MRCRAYRRRHSGRKTLRLGRPAYREVEFMAREDSVPPQTRYTLEGTDRGGILLGYVDERDLTSDYQILFYPWHRIRRIHLLTE
jgi:hypothetical protein